MALKLDEPPPYALEDSTRSGRAIANSATPSIARMDNLEQTRRELQSFGLGNDHGRYTDVYIAVMGCTGAGKSSFIAACTDQDVAVGHDLVSCTIDVEEYTFVYNDSYLIHLVDTPGFDDTHRSDTDILRDVAGWLGTAYQHKILLAGIIYLHRISDPRMGGTARRNLIMFKKLCGEECFSRIVLATTFWSMVSPEVGEKRERDLLENKDFWGYMANKGATVLRHDGQRNSALRIIEHIFKRSQQCAAIPLAIQRELVDQGVELNDTTAGRSLEEELRKQREKFEREIRIMEREKEELLREKDEENARELENEQRDFLKKLARSESSSAALRTNLETLQADMMKKLLQLEDEVERKRAELEQGGAGLAISGSQREADLEDLHAQEDELERQRKGLFARVMSLYRKGSTWVDNNPKSAANLQKAGRIAGKLAVAAMAKSHPAAGFALNAFMTPFTGAGAAGGTHFPTTGQQSRQSDPAPPKPTSPSSPPQLGSNNSRPNRSQQTFQPRFQPQSPAASPNTSSVPRQTPTDRATRIQPINDPNPLGLLLTGTFGVDIILDQFGEQRAWKMGSIWPGPNVGSRFQDASWPDDLGRFVKYQDALTGVVYWVRPFTGSVRGGFWQPF